MTDREKQIEEITAIIDSVLGSSPTLVLQSRVNGGKYKSIKNSEIAEELYNAGYRKMDEITLKLDLGDRSAEEIQQIAEAFANEPTTAILVPSNESVIRKQVAKEILQELANIMNAKCDDINSDDLHNLAKKCGVEIEK